MIYHAVMQNSEEWDALRSGRPTASAFFQIVTPGGKLSKSSRKYRNRLIAERRNGGPLLDPQSAYQSEFMQRGHFLESQAVAAYEFLRNVATQPGGFITTDDGSIGCSPDRLVGDDGLLEIKCPSPAVHMGYVLDGVLGVVEDYYPQLQGQLLITERKWVDIVSYSDVPNFPPVIIRVERDEPYIDNLCSALVEFVREMAGKWAALERDHPMIPIREPSKALPDSTEEINEYGEVPSDHPLGVSDADVEAILKAQGLDSEVDF